MADECQIDLSAAASLKAADQTSARGRGVHRPRVVVVIMALSLCLAAAAAAALHFRSQPEAQGRDGPDADLRHTLRQISNVRAAIHLLGEHDKNVTKSVKWMNDVDQSHSQGGLKLRNNEIVIPQSGLYFVYSQASFRVGCSGDPDSPHSASALYLSHTVKRWSSSFGPDQEDSYRTILHSIRTACQRAAGGSLHADESFFSAVYMGAVFHLKSGDRLKTVMEEKMLEYLEEEPGKTFFGVFAL